MQRRTQLTFLVSGLFILIGAVLMFKFDDSKPAGISEKTYAYSELAASDNYSLGPENAALTIVEYADFQCPACAAQHSILKRFIEKYPGQVRLVYRHFPLPQHSFADSAARAAEAAGQQGRFWEMHDLLFENQDKLGPDDIRQYAVSLGLDATRFENDWNSETASARVSNDFAAGQRLGVNATPTLFINGSPARGAQGEASLEAALQSVLGSQ